MQDKEVRIALQKRSTGDFARLRLKVKMLEHHDHSTSRE